MERVSLVCITYGNLSEALENLADLGNSHFVDEVLILENGDVENLQKLDSFNLEKISFFPFHKLRKYSAEANLGFGPGVQYLLSRAKNETVVVINPDCKPDIVGVFELITHLEECTCTVVSGTIYENGSIYGYRYFVPFLGKTFARDLPKMLQKYAIQYFSGALFVMNRTKISQIGGYSKYFLYFDELDTTLKLHRNGFQIHQLDVFSGEHSGGSVANVLLDGFSPRMYYSSYFACKFYQDYFVILLPNLIVNRLLKMIWLVCCGHITLMKCVFFGTFDGISNKNPRKRLG